MEPRTFSCGSVEVYVNPNGTYSVGVRYRGEIHPRGLSVPTTDTYLLVNLLKAVTSEPGGILDTSMGVELQHQPGRVIITIGGYSTITPSSYYQALGQVFAEALEYIQTKGQSASKQPTGTTTQ